MTKTYFSFLVNTGPEHIHFLQTSKILKQWDAMSNTEDYIFLNINGEKNANYSLLSYFCFYSHHQT